MLRAVPEQALEMALPTIRQSDDVKEEEEIKQEELTDDATIEADSGNRTIAIKDEPLDDDVAPARPGTKRKRDKKLVNIKEEDMENKNQLDKSLITLSNLPKSKWSTLIDLDLIKVCNFVFLLLLTYRIGKK